METRWFEVRYAYAGEHSVLFHNQTGISFEELQLQVSLYQLRDPQQYTDAFIIPELHIYVGLLPAGEAVRLSFSTEMDDYNYFVIGYEYNLETAA